MRNGRMVILVDAEEKENEGDLVIPAQMATPDAINFMAKHGRGLICLSLTKDRADQLRLEPQTRRNASGTGTAFTVSIEARQGVGTGVSAADRLTTVRAAVAPDAQPGDLASPGHVFPLRAEAGGVLARRGHTEGAIDLCDLAGLPRAAVLCELMNADGSMARGAQLQAFAQVHALPLLSIEDLVQWRLRRAQAGG